MGVEYFYSHKTQLFLQNSPSKYSARVLQNQFFDCSVNYKKKFQMLRFVVGIIFIILFAIHTGSLVKWDEKIKYSIFSNGFF